MPLKSLENCFKPEIRKRGEEYFAKDAAVVSSGSDTQIQAYVKGMPVAKVSLVADDIASPVFQADCNCSMAVKGNLCKHVWAVILQVEKMHPDFLDSKKTVDKMNLTATSGSPSTSTAKSAGSTARPQNSSQSASAVAYKAKQDEYKKLQSEKQKLWSQKIRLEQKIKKKKSKNDGQDSQSEYSNEVESALKFFSENGFVFESTHDDESLKKAKKILSQVFHPDKGGTHEEATILNKHYEALFKFFSR